MKNEDEYLKKLASIEQAATNMRPVASVITTYFHALVDNGLTRPEALQLVKDYQLLLIQMGARLNEDQRKDAESEE
jgi:hypothetical protein